MEPSPYRVRLADLERSAHVPVEDQSTTQPVAPVRALAETDEQERQRLTRVAAG